MNNKLLSVTCSFVIALTAPTSPVHPPAIIKRAPVTLAQLAKTKSAGVSVAEVSDYVFGNYQGGFCSPPHADGNPRRAFIIFWKDYSYRFVFSHEGSYCPWFEFPSGVGFCYQFFEGNEGWAELFNDWGRKERNSFIEILEEGPSRVWMRWTYFGVNKETGEAAYRGSEDFWAYPNGLILRRQTYESLQPEVNTGYAREPIEMIGMCPAGQMWFDVLKKETASEDRHALAVLDPFSRNRYDVFWKPAAQGEEIWKGIARRNGCQWKDLDDAEGVALTVPMRDGSPFCVFGDASGFRHDFTRIKEHSFTDTGGWGWISKSWDHWPIGWLNSQGHVVDAESLGKYPNHFSPAGMDFWDLANKESERGEFYSLIGIAGHDLEEVRTIARKWLSRGARKVTNPQISPQRR